MAEIYRPQPSGQRPAPKNGAPQTPRNSAPQTPKKTAPQTPKKKKRKIPPGRRLLLIVICVLGGILLLFGLYHLIVDYYVGLMRAPSTDEIYATHIDITETVDTNLPVVELPEHNGELNKEGLPLICNTRAVTNILLIGIDARAKGNEAGLSDTMMILSINTETKKITLTSIERDLLVLIPDHGQDKLNAAHAYGGADLLIRTLKENFNIEIEHWARVNFYSFVDIVDAVGGLDITMTADEIGIMNYYLLEINELYRRPYGTDNLAQVAGTYHLNGHQTLAYCRNRYSDNDFGRMNRQRRVIDLIIQKAKTLNVLQLDHLLTTVLPMITTDMEQEERHALAAAAPSYLFYQLKSDSLPGDDGWYTAATPAGASVVMMNDKKASMIDLYASIYGKMPDGSPVQTETQTETETKP